ncbi:MAG: HEAT repeat domain-containing protein [Gemmataceae bacterium]|nr:HEAT repeat domain-containing protein [Gemmataceae bacterium]
MTEEAFLSACVAEPDEPAHRLALADWLEERDDSCVRWVRDPDVFPWTLPDLGDPLPRLIAALPDKGAEQVLLKLGAEAVPALLLASMRREPGADRVLRRMQTPEVEAVLDRAGGGGEAELIKMLEDLARIGEPAAVLVPEMASSVANESDAIQAAFVKMVEGLGRATPAALRVAWQYAFLSEATLTPLLCEAAIRSGPHPEIIDGLIIWSRRREDSPEGRALATLAEQSREVVAGLIARLEGEEFAPHAIAMALAAIGPMAAPAVPVLLPLLREEDDHVVSAAAYALGRIGPAASEAVPRLRQLAAPDCPARHEAAAALDAITGAA